MVYRHHIFFIHSSVNRRLGGFHVLATVNSVSVHIGIGMQISFLLIFCYFRIYAQE